MSTEVAVAVLNPGHDDRLVVRAVDGGREVIRKRYRDDAGAAVHAAMSALWRSPFGESRQPCPGLPEPLGYGAADRTLTMAVAPGAALGRRGHLDRTEASLADVARLLADLHGSGVEVPRRRDSRKLLRSLERKLAGRETGLLPRLAALAPADEPLYPSHGDFSPRNVLLGPAGPALIDFDRIQMAGAGRDVQYLAAWCWVTQAVAAGRRPSASFWDVGDRFEAAYLACRPETTAAVVAGRTFHRVSGLVRIATEWSSMRHDADANRLVLDEAWRFASWGV